MATILTEIVNKIRGKKKQKKENGEDEKKERIVWELIPSKLKKASDLQLAVWYYLYGPKLPLIAEFKRRKALDAGWRLPEVPDDLMEEIEQRKQNAQGNRT
ncbi:hypothetical protein DRJ16_02145 [Candidatus Woesearchaeota archaeon]|nr:MAG: hypothetical protein DRJ16_02145 [Candidatus Woesearchaeota archaeon]